MTQSIASIVVGTYSGAAPSPKAPQEIERKVQPAKEDVLLPTRIAEIKQQLKTSLQQGTWLVKFTKVDGTDSEMVCTLDPSIMVESESKGTRPTNPDLLHVYSTDRQGWRSFKVMNVKSITPHIL